MLTQLITHYNQNLNKLHYNVYNANKYLIYVINNKKKICICMLVSLTKTAVILCYNRRAFAQLNSASLIKIVELTC